MTTTTLLPIIIALAILWALLAVAWLHEREREYTGWTIIDGWFIKISVSRHGFWLVRGNEPIDVWDKADAAFCGPHGIDDWRREP